MRTDSLKNRYFAKFSTNLIAFIFSLVTAAIIPRSLGPKIYGDFNFLTNFFTQLLPLFTFSTSIAFYTKLSKRQNEFELISYYTRIVGVAIIFIMLLILCVESLGLSNFFWFEQSIRFVYMAALYSSLIWVINSLVQVSDAYGITIRTEVAKIFQKILALVIILVLIGLEKLDLITFFFYHFTISILLIVSLIILINKTNFFFSSRWKLNSDQIKKYSKEFYLYSQPLFVYAFIGMLVGIFDRWLLQLFGGSEQQGFFSLAMQIGAICFLFTSAMTQLITREFSIAFKNDDLNEMSRLFHRYIPILYSVAAFFGCFISVQAKNVSYIFGGSNFSEAALPVAIMALYPIHQTYGQLSGAVFYATNQTKIYRNIGSFFMLIGIPIVVFLVAPSEQFGLNIGAAGLALKFVILQFLAVNVQLFFNSKYLKLSFKRFFFHQIICVALLLTLAIISKFIIDAIGISNLSKVYNFFCSGILYSLLAVLFMLLFPKTFGLNRSDIGQITTIFKKHL